MKRQTKNTCIIRNNRDVIEYDECCLILASQNDEMVDSIKEVFNITKKVKKIQTLAKKIQGLDCDKKTLLEIIRKIALVKDIAATV